MAIILACVFVVMLVVGVVVCCKCQGTDYLTDTVFTNHRHLNCETYPFSFIKMNYKYGNHSFFCFVFVLNSSTRFNADYLNRVTSVGVVTNTYMVDQITSKFKMVLICSQTHIRKRKKSY